MLNKTDLYFLTIAREGSLSRAAEALYVSQPSLTKYIQRLERQLGTPLFDHTTSPLRLNDAGELYYRHLLECLDHEERLMARLDEIGRTERGTLRLGTPSYCSQCYLPWVLQQFSARYPHVAIELNEDSAEGIERALLDQKIDLGLLHLPVRNGSLLCRELFNEDIFLAVPRTQEASHPCAPEIREGSILDFADHTFIMPHPSQKMGQIVTDLFSRVDFVPRTYLYSQNLFTILSLTALGLGSGFVPAGGLGGISRDTLKKITFYRLKELDNSQWKLITLQRKGYQTPQFTAHFIDLVVQYGQRINLL